MPDFGIFRGFNEKLFGDKLVAGQLPTQLGLIGSEDFGFVGLLDDYPNAAAAYSLRLLRTAYTGNAIEVRRASDNTTQDIGFVNNELDTTSLASFCSATNGFLTTWYDQSGNGNDATQGTASRQPKIYDSSSGVILENGKLAVEFDGSNDFLQATSSLLSTSLFTVFCVFQGVIDGSTRTIIAKNSGAAGRTNFIGSLNLNTQARMFFNDGVSSYNVNTTTPVFNQTQRLVTSQSDGLGNSQIGVNGSIEGTRTNTPWTPQNINVTIGSINGGSFPHKGVVQELIAYESYETTNRTGIETNINDFYSIY